MGSIYKRGKTWWIKYTDRNGQPIRETSRSRTKQVAKELLKIREGEITQGKIPGVHFDKVIVDELADDLILDYEINKKKSIDRAKCSVANLKEYFGGWPVSKITSKSIILYIKQRQNSGVANATINRELSALKRMLNLGANQTPPKVDRVLKIAMLAERNVRKGFFKKDEFHKVRQYLPEHLKPLVTFAYSSGWRHGEVTLLDWHHVDLADGRAWLDPGDPKNEEPRFFFFSHELGKMIQELFDKRESDLQWVFLNRFRTDRVKRL